MRRLGFWFDFASTYSYLSAMRVEREAALRDVDVVWKPFLLGPIFAKQGWATSPFILYPARGAYMKRDLERLCAGRGLTFQLPLQVPAHSVLASRIALIALDEGWGVDFCKAVFAAEFGEGLDIADKDVLRDILRRFDKPSEEILPRAQDEDNKQRLRDAGMRAEALGIFGAPSFVSESGELFWGDDRLIDALEACE